MYEENIKRENKGKRMFIELFKLKVFVSKQGNRFFFVQFVFVTHFFFRPVCVWMIFILFILPCDISFTIQFMFTFWVSVRSKNRRFTCPVKITVPVVRCRMSRSDRVRTKNMSST